MLEVLFVRVSYSQNAKPAEAWWSPWNQPRRQWWQISLYEFAIYPNKYYSWFCTNHYDLSSSSDIHCLSSILACFRWSSQLRTWPRIHLLIAHSHSTTVSTSSFAAFSSVRILGGHADRHFGAIRNLFRNCYPARFPRLFGFCFGW